MICKQFAPFKITLLFFSSLKFCASMKKCLISQECRYATECAAFFMHRPANICEMNLQLRYLKSRVHGLHHKIWTVSVCVFACRCFSIRFFVAVGCSYCPESIICKIFMQAAATIHTDEKWTAFKSAFNTFMSEWVSEWVLLPAH